MRTCTRCGVPQLDDCFRKNARYRDGLTTWCKDCASAYDKAHYQAHKSRRRSLGAIWRRNNKGKARSYELKYLQKHPTRARNKWYMRKYGLTVQQVEDMIAGQGGKCAICQLTPTGNRQAGWHVDHDHSTGKVRGMLCYRCNLTLGISQEDIFRLQRCLFYIRYHKGLTMLDLPPGYRPVRLIPRRAPKNLK